MCGESAYTSKHLQPQGPAKLEKSRCACDCKLLQALKAAEDQATGAAHAKPPLVAEASASTQQVARTGTL